MTLTANYSPDSYTATAGQTVFAYSWKVTDDSEIRVYQNGTLLTLTTHYTVSGVGTGTGGNITLVTGATLADAIVIKRVTPRTQEVDFADGDLPSATLETAADKQMAVTQEIGYALDSVPYIPAAVTAAEAAQTAAEAAQTAAESAESGATTAQGLAETARDAAIAAAASVGTLFSFLELGTAANAEGNRRMRLNNGVMVIEARESGEWVEKGGF